MQGRAREPSFSREMYELDQDTRPIEIRTDDRRIEGALQIHPRLRTLDDLNLVSKEFFVVATTAGAVGTFDAGDVAIHKRSILFVHETDPPQPESVEAFGRFTRAAVRMIVGPYDVGGFVHVPPGVSAMKRINQLTHPFVALSSVKVRAGEETFETSFLAVNRRRIVAAQPVMTAAAYEQWFGEQPEVWAEEPVGG